MKRRIIARVRSDLQAEVLEFVVDDGAPFNLEVINSLIMARKCKRSGWPGGALAGDATGSDYFGPTSHVTAFEVITQMKWGEEN